MSPQQLRLCAPFKARHVPIWATGGINLYSLEVAVTGGFFLWLPEVYSCCYQRFIYGFGLLIVHIEYTPSALRAVRLILGQRFTNLTGAQAVRLIAPFVNLESYSKSCIM